jgi:hypothetical protein
MSQKRPCARCGKPWSAKAFYETIRGCCKACHNARVKARRDLLRNEPNLQAKEREHRRSLPAHKYCAPRDRAATVRRVNRWRMKNRDKDRAINAVAEAIKRYDLERGRCEGCGTDKHVCGFHPDYAKPLAVVWRCRRCNNELRRQAAAAAASSSNQSIDT